MEIPDKVVKGSQVVDPHSSDHVVAMTQLKETIASLQKRLAQKDRDLLQKEKEVSGHNSTMQIFFDTKFFLTDHRVERKALHLRKRAPCKDEGPRTDLPVEI